MGEGAKEVLGLGKGGALIKGNLVFTKLLRRCRIHKPKKWHTLSWDTFCKTKSLGGLVFPL